ncbi:MAG: hypothetical protein ABII79_11470 [bacterium]
MTRMVMLIATLISFLLLLIPLATAEVPQTISYQGRLINSSGTPYNGPVLMKFIIYDGVGTDKWNSAFQTVQVDNGLFEVLLGVPPQPVLPHDLFTDTTRELGITVDSDPEMIPRTKLVSASYAYHALRSDTAGLAQDANKLGSQPPAYYATLSQNNHFTLNNYFDPPASVQIGDSTFRANNVGIIIGNDNPPTSSYLLRTARVYNTSSPRYAHYSEVLNQDGGIVGGLQQYVGNGLLQGNGSLYGVRSFIGNTSGGTGTVYGLYADVNNNPTGGSDRYGVQVFSGDLSNTSGNSYGVRATAYGGTGASVYAIYGVVDGTSAIKYAGYFDGNVHVNGTLSKSGGSFKIDHPVDPEHKYLQHSFVESPDMMNIYNGNVTLDGNGTATVTLPDYFDALNMDFRYQLTCIGSFAPVYVADEISGNHFRIAGGEPGMKVSWLVTGIRNDKWAQTNRIQVEVDKPSTEIGTYLNPEVHGQPIEKHVNYEEMKEDLKRAEGREALNEDSE